MAPTAPTVTSRARAPTPAGLNDSPVGLLAWIVEKLVEWSDTPVSGPQLLEHRISRERILTEATIYWATQSIATSFRPYFDGGEQKPIPRVEVPATVAIQRHEYDYPESVARKFYRDLRAFDRMPEGGHFAIAEVPQVMADRMRSFARDRSAPRLTTTGLRRTARTSQESREIAARLLRFCEVLAAAEPRRSRVRCAR